MFPIRVYAFRRRLLDDCYVRRPRDRCPDVKEAGRPPAPRRPHGPRQRKRSSGSSRDPGWSPEPKFLKTLPRVSSPGLRTPCGQRSTPWATRGEASVSTYPVPRWKEILGIRSLQLNGPQKTAKDGLRGRGGGEKHSDVVTSAPHPGQRHPSVPSSLWAEGPGPPAPPRDPRIESIPSVASQPGDRMSQVGGWRTRDAAREGGKPCGDPEEGQDAAGRVRTPTVGRDVPSNVPRSRFLFLLPRLLREKEARGLAGLLGLWKQPVAHVATLLGLTDRARRKTLASEAGAEQRRARQPRRWGHGIPRTPPRRGPGAGP